MTTLSETIETSESSSGARKSGFPWFGAVLVMGVVVLLGVKLLQMRPAPNPAVLTNAGLLLNDALDRSQAEGKPVLAFATAEWCGPCQSLKRNALADPGVQQLISERTIAVTLEETTPEGAKGIRMLPVRAYPTLMLIKNGEVFATSEGARPTSEITAWLEANTTAPQAAETAPAPAEG